MSIFDQVIEATNSTAPLFIQGKIISKNKDMNVVERNPDSTIEPSIADWYTNAFDFEIINNLEQWDHNGQTLYGDRILTRSDNGAKLGNVTSRYKVVQPSEITNFFLDLADKNGWKIHKAGYCDGGKKLFAFAQTGKDTWDATGKGDKMLNHLLITTSSDGSTATTVQPFMERFYCMNQLPMARKLYNPIKIKHSTHFDPSMIKFELGIYDNAIGKMQEQITKMVQTNISDDQALAMILDAMDKSGKDLSEHSTRSQNQFMDVFGRYRGAGMGAREQGVTGTVWGVLNAITEYVDHSQGNGDNTRFRNAHYGSGFNLKNDAFEVLGMYANEEKEIDLSRVMS